MIIAVGGMALGRLSVRTLRDIRYSQPADEFHRADYDRTADRESIAHERAEVDAEPGERKHRSWRDMMGGPRNRPLPH